MGIFSRNNKKDNILGSVWQVPDLAPKPVIDYNSALDYIISLSRQDFDKLYKVANIYRTANKDANKVLGIKEDPATAIIDEPLSDDEDIAFLMDDDPISIPENKPAGK